MKSQPKDSQDNSNQRIYLDHASTTPVAPEVVEAMQPYWSDVFGNPRSNHQEGKRAQEALEAARAQVAGFINASADEIISVPSATKANSLASLAPFVTDDEADKSPHVLMSTIEHPSVHEQDQMLVARFNAEIDMIPVTCEGVVDLKAFETLLNERTRLVSCMQVNSEIGTIQPVKDISKRIKNHEQQTGARVYLHSDASQVGNPEVIDVEKLGVDLLTLNAHKLYGPKGIAALYVRGADSQLRRGLEKRLHLGTPPVALAVGFGKACQLSKDKHESEMKRLTKLQGWFIETLEVEFPDVRLNGSREQRSVNNVSLTFTDADHHFLQVQLDERGIAASTKSACLPDGEEGSAVIRAIHPNGSPEAIRFTMGRSTTKDDLQTVVEILKELV